MITRYWIFSDGVGIIINDDSLVKPEMNQDVIAGMSKIQLLKELIYSWMAGAIGYKIILYPFKFLVKYYEKTAIFL